MAIFKCEIEHELEVSYSFTFSYVNVCISCVLLGTLDVRFFLTLF